MSGKWWQERVVYQIYPRSFYDTNGDGLGDIRGIISKLDYLQELGIGMLWISPLYPSPNVDNGYDISNYCDIHPDFGSLEEMDVLIAEAKKRDIRIIMDLVINHTSDQHEWFQKSRRKEEPYTDFYIWRSAPAGKKPNNWGGFFGGDTWTYDPVRGEYYLHLFAKEQPDLNYDNEAVIQAVEEVMRFWLDRGVAGFRCDVINIIGKMSLENGRWKPALTGSEHYISTPKSHRILQRFHEDVLSHYDSYTVGETVFVTPEMARDLTLPERKELNQVFAFEHMESDCFFVKWFLRPFKAERFFKILDKWQKELDWGSQYFENHDQPRSVSRFGDDERYHKESAKALALLLLGMKGTPFIYQGQEIGMVNFDFESIEEVQDVESNNIWHLGKKLHLPKSLLWKMIRTKSRDNARTPMQWTDEENAGFTSGTPWLGINGRYQEINVAEAENDPDSILNFYRRVLAYRKQAEPLLAGDYRLEEIRGPVYAFTRSIEGKSLRVVINLSSKTQPSPFQGKAIFSSWEKEEVNESLEPYEAAWLDA